MIREIYMMMYVKTLGEIPQVAECRIPVSVCVVLEPAIVALPSVIKGTGANNQQHLKNNLSVNQQLLRFQLALLTQKLYCNTKTHI